MTDMDLWTDEEQDESDVPQGPSRYYGKYPATVVNNTDPMQLGRIQALVPGVPGYEKAPTTYALPCVPFAGKQRGVFVLPERGAAVWLEFVRGDPRYPIWVGGYWTTAAEVPALALASNPLLPSIVLQTSVKTMLSISEAPGIGVLIRSGKNLISLGDAGIVISNGSRSIAVTDAGVAINGTSLVVT
jgi:uncharacterized protein involved in type VI secretion and phage assembly